MGATITAKAPGREPRTFAVGDGETLWLSASGDHREPADAQLCVRASGGAVWAITARAADHVALSRGRPVMGGVIDLVAAPLTIGDLVWTARRDEHGPRPAIAAVPSACPVCHLAIAAGDEVLACSCGVTTDSRFCATGGTPERCCFACDATMALVRGMGT